MLSKAIFNFLILLMESKSEPWNIASCGSSSGPEKYIMDNQCLSSTFDYIYSGNIYYYSCIYVTLQNKILKYKINKTEKDQSHEIKENKLDY